MTGLLRSIAWTGLAAAVLASAGLAFVFLQPYWNLFRDYGPGLGPRVHGWELLFGLLWCGVPGAVLYGLGWGSAIVLRGRHDPSFLSLYCRSLPALLLFAAAVLGVDWALPRIGQAIYSRQQAEAAKSEAVLGDPAKFEGYIDSAKDVNAPLPRIPDTPLEAAVIRGYPALVRRLVEKGADVSERSLYLAARRGDAETAAYLWDHSKGLSGLDALREAFGSGGSEVVHALVPSRISPDALLRSLCVYEMIHAFQVGQADWEVVYPPNKKGKGLSAELFRYMARGAADKSGQMARGTLKVAVFTRDVGTLRALVESGFQIHSLDGQFSEEALLSKDPEVLKIVEDAREDPRGFDLVLLGASFDKNKEPERRMREYLASQGVRWRKG